MFSADPQHRYDNYNDATRYRVTGELMEVSFQPQFIEGLADGSSRYHPPDPQCIVAMPHTTHTDNQSPKP